MKVLVSACLLGMPCRYDAKAKNHPAVIALGYDWVPICPEVAGGLGTPRPPAEIVGGLVKTIEGQDVTREYLLGAEEALRLVATHQIELAILKARSPACGSGQVYDGSFSRRLRSGDGVCAAALKRAGVKVISEEEIDGHLDRPSESR